MEAKKILFIVQNEAAQPFVSPTKAPQEGSACKGLIFFI